MKKPTAGFIGCELQDVGDDEDVPLICPTRQAPKLFRHIDIQMQASGRAAPVNVP